MNLFEKLNRLDDSLVESKRVVKKRKLTESVEDDFDYSDFIPEEMTQFFCINEEDNEDPNEYMPEKGYRGYKAVASLIACGDYAEDLRDCGYQYALLINDPADNFFVGYVAGDRIYKLTEEDIYDQIGIDYDDDIDEMLTESTEQYELSTLVKDSINHLVNNLGKDPMADDFGDDVCADLEDNYDIYVPQNPVKYADWCDAVMSEVSRQLNNKEELTEANTKTAYSYKNYTICYGYKNTDRWYVKDSNNQFVGTVSGYSTEEEAKDYVDSVTT